MHVNQERPSLAYAAGCDVSVSCVVMRARFMPHLNPRINYLDKLSNHFKPRFPSSIGAPK
jgi:hypothetical protein